MCSAATKEGGEVRRCIREFPEIHREHFSADGFTWKAIRDWEEST